MLLFHAFACCYQVQVQVTQPWHQLHIPTMATLHSWPTMQQALNSRHHMSLVCIPSINSFKVRKGLSVSSQPTKAIQSKSVFVPVLLGNSPITPQKKWTYPKPGTLPMLQRASLHLPPLLRAVPQHPFQIITKGYLPFTYQKPLQNPPAAGHLFGPCGREEHGVSTFRYMLQDPLDLRFKTHVQHTICFIQDLRDDAEVVYGTASDSGGWVWWFQVFQNNFK